MEKIRRFFYDLMVDENRSPFFYPLKFILWMLSVVYGQVLLIRDILYRTGMIKVHLFPETKVISIGNITVGGTGKTSTVIKLALLLREKGKKVAVLLRGYGEDEYKMLKDYLGDIPVIKDKDRIKSGKEAIDKHKADTLILDDGFQYKKLKKDFNIVLIDSRCPFGNNHLLPRGILREKISNLKEADVAILTKTVDDLFGLLLVEQRIKIVSGIKRVYKTYYKPSGLHNMIDGMDMPLDFLKDKTVATLSSIGDSVYFNSLLKDLGARIILDFSFMDHHNYTKEEIVRIINLCKAHRLNTVITTDKDAVKLAQFDIDKSIQFFSLKVTMEFRIDEDEFVNRLLGIYSC